MSLIDDWHDLCGALGERLDHCETNAMYLDKRRIFHRLWRERANYFLICLMFEKDSIFIQCLIKKDARFVSKWRWKIVYRSDLCDNTELFSTFSCQRLKIVVGMHAEKMKS